MYMLLLCGRACVYTVAVRLSCYLSFVLPPFCNLVRAVLTSHALIGPLHAGRNLHQLTRSGFAVCWLLVSHSLLLLPSLCEVVSDVG